MKPECVRVALSRPDYLTISTSKHRCEIHCPVDKFSAAWHTTPSESDRNLVNLVVAIYAADRLIKRGRSGWRRIQLNVETSKPGLLPDDWLRELTGLLWRAGGDVWEISLGRVPSPPHWKFQQQDKFLKDFQPPVCLYSDGLDSATGLAIKLRQEKRRWLAVTVATQPKIVSQVRKQFTVHRRHVSRSVSSALLWCQLENGPSPSAQEKSQRTRGLLFCLAGALAAKWSGSREVEVFENGVGAFNMPVMSGMCLGSLSTRGAHPIFLDQLAALYRQALHWNFSYLLPFGWHTKAQMLQMIPEPYAQALISLSRSCIHTNMRISQFDHCGECPACLERQIDIAGAGLREDLSRYKAPPLNIEALPTQARLYALQRLATAEDAVSENNSYYRRRNNYMTTSGIALDSIGGRAFDRLMRQNGIEARNFLGGRDKPFRQDEVRQ